MALTKEQLGLLSDNDVVSEVAHTLMDILPATSQSLPVANALAKQYRGIIIVLFREMVRALDAQQDAHVQYRLFLQGRAQKILERQRESAATRKRGTKTLYKFPSCKGKAGAE
jgi:hypothetical protein